MCKIFHKMKNNIINMSAVARIAGINFRALQARFSGRKYYKPTKADYELILRLLRQEIEEIEAKIKDLI